MTAAMPSLTLDDLIALNDEIASLTRAGVPLEEGLAEIGADLPGRLGRFTVALAERAAQGESLGQVLASNVGRMPSAYRAVIEAGVRAGRLPAAVESISTSARRIAEMRHSALIAMIYPLMVTLVAWCGFLFFVSVLAPRLAIMFHDFNVPTSGFLAYLASAGQYVWCWGPIYPAVVVVVLIGGWLTRRYSPSRQCHWGNRVLDRIPWVGSMLRLSRTASFLEVLALLVENQTPLPESILLAAEASDDPNTLQSAKQLAASLQNGQTQPLPGDTAFPPLTQWLLSVGGRDEALLPALRHAASASRRRAVQQTDLFRTFMPVALTIAVSGSVTALYALMLFIPYVSMFYTLGR